MKSSEGKSSSKNVVNPFVVEMYSSIPASFDTANIGSSAQYNIIHHLVRTPVRYSKDYLLEGDLLESWQVSSDYKSFLLVFKKNQYFSNGHEILAADFVKSVDRLRNVATTIHFDFSSILTVKASSKYGVRITLRRANGNFIKQLAHPEFGIVFNPEKSLTLDSYKVSSGPFLVEQFDPQEIKLKRNPFFPSKYSYPELLVWKSSPADKQLNDLISGRVDVSLPNQSFGIKEHKEISKNSSLQTVDTHLGYTFFLSLNPKSKLFGSLTARRSFLKYLREAEINFSDMGPIWERADQLYLPGGFGRPQENVVNEIWNRLTSEKSNNSLEPRKIKLLFSGNFIFEKDIVNHLKKKFQVSVDYYRNFDEYSQKILGSVYDLAQVNNDFSSADLIENLLVTFKESRPLIYISKDHEIQNILNQVSNEESATKRQDGIRKISILLLEEGYIFPVAYNRKFVYAKKNISFSNWSKVFPDVRFWKVCVDGCP